jgi:DNA topoisomerase IA
MNQGITYSVMSASWDPDREGSFLGWDEFQLNLQNVQDGLRRSRSNAILREKMSNLSTKEVQEALQDLDRREMKK